MKKAILQAMVLALIAVLLVSLTLAVISAIDPLLFWAIAGISAVFAFLVLPRINGFQKE
jgi:uncharacterized membrane protein YqjE